MDADWKRMETLKFVTRSMNHLSLIGAREEMRKMGKTDILSYVGNDPVKTQLFLEYVYVGNRIGGGLSKGILDAQTVFGVWSSQWWLALWKKLEPLIKKEREKRSNNKLYDNFEWLIKQLEKK